MSASNDNQESNSSSDTSTTMSLTGMTINSLGINKRDMDQISRIVSDDALGTEESKRRKLSSDITTSQNHPFHPVRRVPQAGRRKRPLSPVLSSSPPVPVLQQPCNYLMKLFHTKGLQQNGSTSSSRIDSFSIEQAFYFEAYQEAEISTDILQALRSSNVEQLRSFLTEKKNGLKECRNQFGENLLHLACRMGGISWRVIAFLIQEAQVPLNVRDRFGRTPLHHACMSSHPNFDTIECVIRHVPRICLLFEDDTGNIPFDLIPSRCYEGWTRFLSETKNILHNNNTQESASSAS
mmetsp:Transcript_19325/g.21613  ORF Transcript_19325/g.21613 Transcript_19325/m.21613 type:complete len:294 (+) Transcript_19325:99-980(+)